MGFFNGNLKHKLSILPDRYHYEKSLLGYQKTIQSEINPPVNHCACLGQGNLIPKER